MNALTSMGFEGYNLYLKHLKPHLLNSKMRPILALENGFKPSDIDSILEYKNAWIEASIIDSAQYGQVLTEADIRLYQEIVVASQRPVIIPSQKKIETGDIGKLKKTGIYALLLGIIVTGNTPESIFKEVKSFVGNSDLAP